MPESFLPEPLPELKVEVDRLHALLADPEPGLITWNMFVGETWKRIAELWSGVGGKR